MAKRAVLVGILVVAYVSFQWMRGRPDKAVHADAAKVGTFGGPHEILDCHPALVGVQES
jgi:hypothetical protein